MTHAYPHPNPPPLAGEGAQLSRQRLPSSSPARGGGSGWGLCRDGKGVP